MYLITSPDQQNSAASDTFSTIKRGAASFSRNGHDEITKNLSFELEQINIKFSFGG